MPLTKEQADFVLKQTESLSQQLLWQVYWTQGLTIVVVAVLGVGAILCIWRALALGESFDLETHWGGLGGGVGGFAISPGTIWASLALIMILLGSGVTVKLSEVRLSLMRERVTLIASVKTLESR